MNEMDNKFECVFLDVQKYITKIDDLVLIRNEYEFAK